MLAYVKEMQPARMSAGIVLTAAQHHEFRRTCSERFASMSKADQKVYADKAKHWLAERDAAADEVKPDNVT